MKILTNHETLSASGGLDPAVGAVLYFTGMTVLLFGGMYYTMQNHPAPTKEEEEFMAMQFINPTYTYNTNEGFYIDSVFSI